MRTTPVLEIEPGRYLPESNAILVYLARGTRYLPDDPSELAQVMRWLIYEQTDVVPMIGGLRFRLLADG
jgi:glutathione S-transferase